MERPITFLVTPTTTNTAYQDVINYAISADAKGVSHFVLSIDPDPNALYKIMVAKVLNANELEITAIWSLELPHLTSGVYAGFAPGDIIIVQHRSPTGVAIKTGATMTLNEVVGGC